MAFSGSKFSHKKCAQCKIVPLEQGGVSAMGASTISGGCKHRGLNVVPILAGPSPLSEISFSSVDLLECVHINRVLVVAPFAVCEE